ncbi:hypothetical protein HYS54_02610 [Candidatus Micrarchaeota archaeon]|nr:hypothetical protein [Candidatus Micrarchaeota archaeon]
MGDIIMLVILAIAIYVGVIIHELGHFIVWPHGLVMIRLNPLRSWTGYYSQTPEGLVPLRRAAGIMAELGVAFILPPYFAVGGLFGAFLTALGFATFYGALVSMLWGGLFAPVGFRQVGGTSDMLNMFGKNYRLASLVLAVIVVIVFQYYVVNTPAFLKAFLP